MRLEVIECLEALFFFVGDSGDAQDCENYLVIECLMLKCLGN
jgi:hypothetical protein